MCLEIACLHTTRAKTQKPDTPFIKKKKNHAYVRSKNLGNQYLRSLHKPRRPPAIDTFPLVSTLAGTHYSPERNPALIMGKGVGERFVAGPQALSEEGPRFPGDQNCSREIIRGVSHPLPPVVQLEEVTDTRESINKTFEVCVRTRVCVRMCVYKPLLCICFVCVCVCIYTYICIHTHTDMPTYWCAACAYVQTTLGMYTYIHIWVCIHTYAYMYMYIYICMLHIYIYIYIYIYINT